MNKKYFPLFIILSIIIVVLIFSYNGTVSGEGKAPDRTEINLEDSIIIRGINMESDITISERDDSKTEAGRIIYDYNFHDSIPDIDIRKTKNKDNKLTGSSILENMRKKNSRWHFTRYRIKRNDNLWNLAKSFGISHRLIISVNNITDPDMLLPGRYLDIPNKIGIYYTIKKNDTISGISEKFKVDKNKIKEQNNLKSSGLLIGKKIFIPDAVEFSAKKKSTREKIVNNIEHASRKIKFIWPIRGRLTSGFGTRKDPFSNRREFHCGIDISSEIGNRIRASASGRVIFSGWKSGYGRVVIIRHKYGYITVYAHNSKNIVKVNDRINRGDIIAYTGNSGAVTGAHLHFEIRKYVTPLNPMRFLK